jgi:hypothetical protein
MPGRSGDRAVPEQHGHNCYEDAIIAYDVYG